MGYPIIFLGLLLLQSAFAQTDDAIDDFDLFNPEDETNMETYMDRKARNDKFLRFGRRFWEYDYGNGLPYDDSDGQRPPRTGRQEKNDDFLRFGRSRVDSLRLNGDPQQRTTRNNKTNFLRFGRSITEENKKKREKRGAIPVPSSDAFKRHESFLRFGRNSNFMRFGRNPGHAQFPSYTQEALLKQIFDSRNDHLISYLNNLLKQSKDNLGHNNEI